MLGPAAKTVADLGDDVLIAKPLERLRRLLPELLVDLDRIHGAHERAEHGRLIAAAGADLEHLVGGFGVELLGHVGHDERPRDRLRLTNRQRHVEVGEASLRPGHEFVPRRRPHGSEHALVGDAAGRDVVAHHPLAGGLGGIRLRPGPDGSLGRGFDGQAGREYHEPRARGLPHGFHFPGGRIFTSSISNTSTSLGSMTGGEPSSPYPSSGGT